MNCSAATYRQPRKLFMISEVRENNNIQLNISADISRFQSSYSLRIRCIHIFQTNTLVYNDNFLAIIHYYGYQNIRASNVSRTCENAESQFSQA